jgi:hypothetical protein
MPVDPHRVQAVLFRAVDLPDPAGRAALLDRECAPSVERAGTRLIADCPPLSRPAAGTRIIPRVRMQGDSP